TAVAGGVPVAPAGSGGAGKFTQMTGTPGPWAKFFALLFSRVPPLFRWLGPLGAIPLPSNWIIEFLPPVPTDDYPVGDEDAIAELSDRIRDTIQQKLHLLVDERGPPFG